MSPKPPALGPIKFVEFVGLPGSGKSTIANCLEAELKLCGLQVVSRTSILADTSPFFRRHARRLWVVARNAWTCRDLYRRSFLLARQSRQETVWDLAKVSWNLWTVMALIAEGDRRQGTTVIVDQGLLQAIWSVQLTASQPFSPDQWKDLLLIAGIRSVLIVNIQSEIEVAYSRASTRNSNTSRLTHRVWNDAEMQWQSAADIIGDLMQLATAMLDPDETGYHVIAIENNKAPPEMAAAAIASAILARKSPGRLVKPHARRDAKNLRLRSGAAPLDF